MEAVKPVTKKKVKTRQAAQPAPAIPVQEEQPVASVVEPQPQPQPQPQSITKKSETPPPPAEALHSTKELLANDSTTITSTSTATVAPEAPATHVFTALNAMAGETVNSNTASSTTIMYPALSVIPQQEVAQTASPTTQSQLKTVVDNRPMSPQQQTLHYPSLHGLTDLSHSIVAESSVKFRLQKLLEKQDTLRKQEEALFENLAEVTFIRNLYLTVLQSDPPNSEFLQLVQKYLSKATAFESFFPNFAVRAYQFLNQR